MNTPENSLIECTSVSFKTMADGTLRQTIDYSPEYAQNAFKMYGQPGTPMFTGRLTQEAAKQSAQDKIIEEYGPITVEILTGEKKVDLNNFDKPKGGELAKLAGIFCKDIKFWEFMVCDNEHQAIESIYNLCGIESRSELDNNDMAAGLFHKLIREPYSLWLRENG